MLLVVAGEEVGYAEAVNSITHVRVLCQPEDLGK